MKRFSHFICKNNILILIIGFLLLIPSVYGFIHTKVNYNILVYLPDNIDTIQGEKILTEDFGLGAYAFVITDMKDSLKVLSLEDDIRHIDGVNNVISVVDVLGTTIPKEMLPSEVVDALYHKDESVIFVSFDGATSEDSTVDAVTNLREVVKDASSVSSMTAMLLDTRDTADKEILAYILIAVVLCVIVLSFTTNSYVMPYFLLGNIGIAILYNMGTNIFLGNISYITKAISAVLQLGVTTDFSIFLYHKYEQSLEKVKNNKKAMEYAIEETFKSVIGSSLTTFAGFLALCTMDLTLGKDIGIVMAKGVLFGLITVLTIFPALILTFDSLIQKTKHRMIFPSFRGLQKFSLKHYIAIFITFLLLMIPAYIGNKNYSVYYKLDKSLPSNLPFNVANEKLAKDFHIISPEMILLDSSLKKNDILAMIEEIKKVDGIDFVIAPSTLTNDGSVILPDEFSTKFSNGRYQLVLLNSSYEIASSELNHQIEEVSNIVKIYDKNAIVAGEGPLMKDLVSIADHDFKMVNYTSIAVIFLIMVFVLQSISLPIILIFTIEFAIFVNMSFAFYMHTSLPFIASIVVGTIQLGATIDYAILMSTRYLEERVANSLDKKEAMKNTLQATVPSIITSALCFFAATVGVAFYTKIDVIGSICTLLARGSIISMFVVILVLPSLLLLCDKVVIQFTRIKKEGMLL